MDSNFMRFLSGLRLPRVRNIINRMRNMLRSRPRHQGRRRPVPGYIARSFRFINRSLFRRTWRQRLHRSLYTSQRHQHFFVHSRPQFAQAALNRPYRRCLVLRNRAIIFGRDVRLNTFRSSMLRNRSTVEPVQPQHEQNSVVEQQTDEPENESVDEHRGEQFEENVDETPIENSLEREDNLNVHDTEEQQNLSSVETPACGQRGGSKSTSKSMESSAGRRIIRSNLRSCTKLTATNTSSINSPLSSPGPSGLHLRKTNDKITTRVPPPRKRSRESSSSDDQ